MATMKDRKTVNENSHASNSNTNALESAVSELTRNLAALVEKCSALEKRLSDCEASCKASANGNTGSGDFVTKEDLHHFKKKIAHAAKIRLP